MNALKKTALGLTIVAASVFGTKAQNNLVAFNDNAKVVKNNGLTNYKSAIPGNAGDVGMHTGKSGSLGMVVYGPPGSKNLKSKANELFNTYKPHVNDFIVTYQEDPDFKEILVGVAHNGNARPGAYGVDDMIGAYEQVLKHYGIDVSKTTASIAGLDLDR